MNTVPKALATVAFLKTKLDEGCDHLGLFEPLILDSLAHISTPDFISEDITALVNTRTGLLLPANAIQTLLGRCSKRGLVDRFGGRWHRTSKPIQSGEFEALHTKIQCDQDGLGRAFVDFASDKGVLVGTPADALQALATFVSDNKVQVILNEAVPDSPLDRSSLDRKLTRVIARFITGHCLQSPTLREALEGLTEGILLQDTLLMRDLPDACQRFQDLLVVFDTGTLFAAIGLAGVANGVAAKEALALLRAAGARTIAFSRTLDEMRRILSLYEERLATTSGRLSLHPTPLTQYFLSARLSPADIRVISATLFQRLEKVGIKVRDLPAHLDPYTLNEDTLAKSLSSPEHPNLDSPRIRHDVDCIAGVLTVRHGHVSTSIERSKAIFCTSSGSVVRAIQQWYFTEGEHGTPPIIHQAALSSIAWLKKPAAAPSVKIHELSAVCLAIMRPTRATWSKFVNTLTRLRTDGTISDDETAAIVASELTEPLLARLDDDFEPDSDSIQETIERVRDTYRREAAVAAEKEISRIEAQARSSQSAFEEALRVARGEASEAQRSASQAITTRDEIVAAIDRRLRRRSKMLSDIVFWLGVGILTISAIFSIPGVLETKGSALAWLARAIFIPTTAFGLYRAINGKNLKDLRQALDQKISDKLRSRWLPQDVLSERSDFFNQNEEQQK
jgi:hypothetical protein